MRIAVPVLLCLGALLLPASASAWCGQACFHDHNDCLKCGFAVYQQNVTCWSGGCQFCFQDYCLVNQSAPEEALQVAGVAPAGASAQVCRPGTRPATHGPRVVRVDVLAARS